MGHWIQCHKIRRWRRGVLLYLLGLSLLLFWIDRKRDYLVGQVMIHKALWTKYDKTNPKWRIRRIRALRYEFMRQKDFDTPTPRMLCSLLDHAEPEVRRAAAINLSFRAGSRTGGNYLSVLKRYEQDPEPEVREFCLVARVYLGDREALLRCAAEMNAHPCQTMSYYSYLFPIRHGLFREAGDSCAQHLQSEMINHRYPYELALALYHLMDRKANYGKEFGEKECAKDSKTWKQLDEQKKKSIVQKLLAAWTRIRPECRSIADFRDGDTIRVYSGRRLAKHDDGWIILGIIAGLVASVWILVYTLLAFLCIRRSKAVREFLRPLRDPCEIA